MQAIIQTHDLRKIYGMGDIQVAALNGVDVRIDEGEFVAVMGPSGSGKSTLMNILGCLDRPTDGRYILAGEDVSGLNKVQLAAIRNRRLGFIFQSFNLLSRTSALRNVMLPLVYKRQDILSPKEREEKAMAALESVGLADRAHHEPNELSGGQRQRIAIARAFLKNAPVLILDEATSGLDALTESDIQKSFETLMANKTTLVIAHRLSTLRSMDRILVFDRGNIVEDGTHRSLLARPTLYKELWDAQVGDFLPLEKRKRSQTPPKKKPLKNKA